MSKSDTYTHAVPFTSAGVRLGAESELGLPEFRVEECGYLPRGAAWNFDDVISPYWRLYWNSRPGSRVIIAGRSYALHPKKVGLLPAGLRFDTRGLREIPHLWLHFTIFPHLLETPSRPIFLPVDAVIGAALDALRGCWSRRTSPAEFYHRSRSLVHAALARYEGFRRPGWPPALDSLLAFMQANAATPIDNRILARRVGRSVEGFVRWFREQTQTTPHQYLMELRVRQAARDLLHTDKSLEQIAEENGFANRNYFTRIFTKTIGLSPAAFRRRRLGLLPP